MKYKFALVRPPPSTFSKGLTTEEGNPDYELAKEQHRAYCEGLRKAGLGRIRLSKDEDFPDSCFIEDTAIITNKGVILTNPGTFSRRGEVNFVENIISALGIPILGKISEGYLDGGDVVKADNHYFIGYSCRNDNIRTTIRGVKQLEKILNQQGYTSSRIPVKSVLHLSTGSSYVGKNIILTIPENAVFYRKHNGLKVIETPEGEEYAANMRLINNHLLMPIGYPKTKKIVQSLANIIQISMSEFKKQDGSMTCLSLLVP